MEQKIFYKEYPKHFIGTSEISSLTVRFPMAAKMLHFGSADSYHAYVVDENAEIADYYSLIHAGRTSVKIFDDKLLTFEAEADTILIYRAGNAGCVIQLINPKSVNGEELKIFAEDEYDGIE